MIREIVNMKSEDVKDLDEKYFFHVFKRYDLVADKGEGVYLYDKDGKKYLDFVAGIAVNLFGYNYPKLTAKIKEQAEKLVHCSNYFYTEEQAKLAEKLCNLSCFDKVFFGNSGAEANEGAIKLARKWGVSKSPLKDKIISCNNSFHGRTLAALTATGQPKFHQGLGALPPDFVYVPYNDIEVLESFMDDNVAAVMLEPIQGEGGVVVPDKGYLKKVRELCDKHDCLMIVDEIQTGVARTGKMFAYEHEEIKPDIMTLAKALGGGLPISAILATDKIAKAFNYGDHGSTFGGNPFVCGVALKVLELIEEENILNNVNEVSKYFIESLNELTASEKILKVRGKGLMLGAELNEGIDGPALIKKCLANGLHINLTAGKVLRFLPPLNITKSHVDEMIEKLKKSLS
ncbi:MAG: Acetylornithine aminotransferase [Alphaproteobacteria bacterium ADurb.Bin438]|nr:MAG: Acetylornithine aminotransferase [Alphaproteobacteria bacterium ADurb.Bin438]